MTSRRFAADIPVQAFRLVLLLPLRLLEPAGKANMRGKPAPSPRPPGYEAAVKAMEAATTDWQELSDLLHQSDDVCAAPSPGQDDQLANQRYAEFVYFHPYIQKFLYRHAAASPSGRRNWPMRVWQHTAIRRMQAVLPHGQTAPHGGTPPFTMNFDVSRCQIKLFSTGNAFLTLELALRDALRHNLAQVQDAIDFLRHTYPAYWAGRPEGGRYPMVREWQDARGAPVAGQAQSVLGDVNAMLQQRREAFLSAVTQRRTYPLDDHFACLLKPLEGLYAQIEDERMPHLAFVAVDDASTVSKADQVRLAFADYRGSGRDSYPYAKGFLKDFDKRHAYDRWWAPAHGYATRYLNVGYGFTALGSGDFFVGQLQSDFRRLYVQLATLAHFNKAALLTFSNRLADGAALNGQSEAYRRHTHAVLSDLMAFTQMHWFGGVSNQVQASELYAQWHTQLGLQAMYDDVAREARESNEFLARNAAERQANAVEQLTKGALFVAAIGLVLAAAGAGFPWDKPLAVFLNQPDDFCWWWSQGCSVTYELHRLLGLAALSCIAAFMWWRFHSQYVKSRDLFTQSSTNQHTGDPHA